MSFFLILPLLTLLRTPISSLILPYSRFLPSFLYQNHPSEISCQRFLEFRDLYFVPHDEKPQTLYKTSVSSPVLAKIRFNFVSVKTSNLIRKVLGVQIFCRPFPNLCQFLYTSLSSRLLLTVLKVRKDKIVKVPGQECLGKTSRLSWEMGLSPYGVKGTVGSHPRFRFFTSCGG